VKLLIALAAFGAAFIGARTPSPPAPRRPLSDDLPPARPVREIKGAPPAPTLRDYQPKPALKSVPHLDDVEAIRATLRGMPYHRFMEAAAGMGAEPAALWRFAVGANVTPLRRAA
jgi:hypothetical protein